MITDETVDIFANVPVTHSAHQLLLLQRTLHGCLIIECHLFHHVDVVVSERSNAVDDSKATFA